MFFILTLYNKSTARIKTFGCKFVKYFCKFYILYCTTLHNRGNQGYHTGHCATLSLCAKHEWNCVPFVTCLVDSKDLLPHNFLVILYLPCLLCMYEILSLCTYLFVFCHLYASFSQAYFIRFHYVYIYCNYLHLQKSKLLRLSFLSKSLKLKCSIFVLNLLVAGQNIDR